MFEAVASPLRSLGVDRTKRKQVFQQNAHHFRRQRAQSKITARSIVAQSAVAVATTKKLQYTALGGNGWSAKFEGAQQTVLVDPWLVGDLTFGSAKTGFLYRGFRPDGPDDNLIAGDDVNVILLTQGLDDHTHRPTLEKLSKDIPVVAAPSAAKIATALGFELVFPVAHNDTITLDNIRFRATAGGLVGPPWSTRENGFVIEDMTNGLRLYYEPHVDYVEESVQSAASEVDIIVTPTTSITFIGYPIVQGSPRNVERLLKLLKPQVLIPLRNDLTVNKGAISSLIHEEGGLEAVRTWLAGEGRSITNKPIRIEEARSGERLLLQV